MKSILFATLVALTAFSCYKQKIDPTFLQNKVSTKQKNLKIKVTLKPDLLAYSFTTAGTISSDASFYNIPFVVKETNLGTLNDVGAYADSLKVYQVVLVGFTTSYRLVGTYVRTVNLPINGAFFINNIIRFPRKWRPSTGKINLVFKADGGLTIDELDETNNFSNIIYNIYLP